MVERKKTPIRPTPRKREKEQRTDPSFRQVTVHLREGSFTEIWFSHDMKEAEMETLPGKFLAQCLTDYFKTKHGNTLPSRPGYQEGEREQPVRKSQSTPVYREPAKVPIPIQENEEDDPLADAINEWGMPQR